MSERQFSVLIIVLMLGFGGAFTGGAIIPTLEDVLIGGLIGLAAVAGLAIIAFVVS